MEGEKVQWCEEKYYGGGESTMVGEKVHWCDYLSLIILVFVRCTRITF